MKESLFTTLEQLGPGDHICCIYRSEDEHRSVITPFVRLGLERNHKVIYIVDIHTAETVKEYFQEEEIDTEQLLEKGQLILLTRHETYTSGGSFDPDAMISLLRDETRKALEEGYDALRVTGEMTWALTGLPGTERLIEYENKLNQFMPRHCCLAICQYDKRRFSPEVLLDVLRTHPYAIIGTEVYENFYYMPPEELLGEDSAGSELDKWIANLHNYNRTKRDLQESEERYRNLYNSIRDAILVTDTEGNITHCNQAFAELFGYSLQEIEGHSTDFLYNDEEEFRSLGKRMLHLNKRELLYTVHYRKKTDGKFPGETKVYALTDGEGRTTGFITLIRDITEKMRVEEELHREKNFVEAIFETSGAIITEIDPQGHILQVNGTGETITGYTSSELRNKPLWDFLLEEEYEDVQGVFQKLLDGEYPNQHQNHWIAKNGERRFIAWTNTVVPDRNGKVSSIISTGIDITERKQEEENRIRRLENEVARLERYSSPNTTTVTGQVYAQKSFREEETEEFERLLKEYETILAHRMEERTYKTDKHISPRLQTLAQTLGRATAGPRDVVELHVRALKNSREGTTYKRAQVLAEEGRLLAMELMGYLVSFYRNQLTTASEDMK
jgi:PAS domain S-box-containing protein